METTTTNNQTTNGRHDVEDYHDVFSAYLNARTRMNGDLPVCSASSSPLVQRRRLDRNRLQELKNGRQVKGERRADVPQRQGTRPCQRCGHTRDWARDCTLTSTKRPRFGKDSLDESMVVVTSEPEFLLREAFLTSVDISAREAVLDGGAQSFVVGRDTLMMSRHS